MKENRVGRAVAPVDDATHTHDGPLTRRLFPIVGIGASAGGLEAFSELLKHLPLDTGMGFVLVQHLDPEHDSALDQMLGRATSMPVHEVTNKLRVEANHVYVIPRNTNLGILGGVLTLRPRPKTRAPHRSIDFFLEALAADQRELAIGVILSGTAHRRHRRPGGDQSRRWHHVCAGRFGALRLDAAQCRRRRLRGLRPLARAHRPRDRAHRQASGYREGHG